MKSASVNWNRLLLLLLFLGIVFLVFDFLKPANSRTVKSQTTSQSAPVNSANPSQTPVISVSPTPIPTHRSIIPRGEQEGGFDN